MLKKYIGTKQFYKYALSVAVPMMLQNFITNFVNMLDNLMVGSLGTEQMSGVAIVNQIIFVFNLAVFGGLSGVGIFTAQFFGKQDENGMRYSFRCKIALALILCAVGIPLFFFADEALISLFLHSADDVGNIELTLDFAKKYLAIAVIGLLPYAFANVFSSTLRETGEPGMPVVAGGAAVAVNVIFNYLLIFGKFGFPQLGVEGAAIATVMSRFVECLIIIIYTFKKRNRFSYIKGAFRSLYVPKSVLFPVLKKGMPLLINEILWSGGMSTLSIAFSMHGLSVVAAYSISSTVTNLFNIVFMSMGASIGIISGNLLGAGKHKEAIDSVRKLIAFSVFLSICMGAIMFVVGGAVPNLYKTDELSRSIATYFIRVCAVTAPLASFANANYFTLRSGGKTVVTFFFDCGTLWLISIPTAFILYALNFSIYWVFPIIQLLDIIKDIVGYILVKKRVWVNTII